MTDNPLDQGTLTCGSSERAEGAVPVPGVSSGATLTPSEGSGTGEGASVRQNRIPEVRGSCSGCVARWASPKYAHCSGCHVTFTSVTGFDKHRSPVGEHGACLLPVEAGLVERKPGVWSFPPDPNRRYPGAVPAVTS